ncbi:MAG: YggT family protein [SAR324 cluster bacterium]|nr:YggT family protein [SAR324 cluster bacterium]MCH8888593.1 YggT family protein [SAR324 cluster bacterium]
MSSLFNFLTLLTQWGLLIYYWIIILAILITWVTPDPRNPLVQFLNTMTLPLFNWVRRFLPSALVLLSAYCSLLLVLFLQIFMPGILWTFGVFSEGGVPGTKVPVMVAGFFLQGVGYVMESLLFFLIVLLLIWFFLTLINPSVNNPIVRAIYFLVDPLISPIQRRLPRQRFDVSPLVAAGGFLAIILLLLNPLDDFARQLTFGNGALPFPQAF